MEINTKNSIIIFITTISRSSGGLSSALDLAETLHALGYKVRVGLTTSSFMYKIRGKKHFKTKLPLQNIFTVPKSVSRIVENDQNKPADFNPVTIIKQAGRSILTLLFDNKVPLTNELADTDLIIDAASFSGRGLETIKRHSGALVVLNHAGSPQTFEDNWLTDDYLLEPAATKAQRYVKFCKRYDAILFQSVLQAEECWAKDITLKDLCYVVPPSCQESEVLGASQLKSPYQTGRRAIVCVGSIQPRKAQHLALEAFLLMASCYKNVDLHFVGSGKEREYGADLAGKVKKLAVDSRVFFHGYCKDYLRYMTHADLLVQSSEAEGVSRVLREAMLMKLPIVSFNISGTANLLEEGTEALLVKPGDIPALAQAMSNILENGEKAKEVANAAFRRYLLNNSWAAYAWNLKETVDELIKTKHMREMIDSSL